jgi:hypothetical protein
LASIFVSSYIFMGLTKIVGGGALAKKNSCSVYSVLT